MRLRREPGGAQSRRRDHEWIPPPPCEGEGHKRLSATDVFADETAAVCAERALRTCDDAALIQPQHDVAKLRRRQRIEDSAGNRCACSDQSSGCV